MTAVDQPDNGQDEGRLPRTCASCYESDHGDCMVESPSFFCPCPCRRAGAGEQQREQVARWLFAHDGSTPSAWDRLLNDAGKRVWLQYADELLTLLDRTQPDVDPGPQCPSTSHPTDGGWRCEHRAQPGSGAASHHPRQEFHE